jgi:hypothetical protein
MAGIRVLHRPKLDALPDATTAPPAFDHVVKDPCPHHSIGAQDHNNRRAVYIPLSPWVDTGRLSNDRWLIGS